MTTDVPHWAHAMIRNWRTALSLPSQITDGMIFAQLQDLRGFDKEDEEEEMKLWADTLRRNDWNDD